jgi:cytochrome P450
MYIISRSCRLLTQQLQYNVSIHQYATYRYPSNFKNPDQYIPERWISAEYSSDNRSALQPFSVGPRNCIGKNMAYHEMRLVITKLLWNFDFKLTEGSRGWAEGQRVFSLWEKRPLELIVKIRA